MAKFGCDLRGSGGETGVGENFEGVFREMSLTDIDTTELLRENILFCDQNRATI